MKPGKTNQKSKGKERTFETPTTIEQKGKERTFETQTTIEP